MPGLELLIERHRRLTRDFARGDMRMPPRLGVIILTCVDPRVAPADILGLEPGDAFVLRNVGARVTPEVETDLAMIWFLMRMATQQDEPELELAIIHHTDCGMERLADPAVRRRLADTHMLDEQAIARRAIADPKDSVHEDIRRLAESTRVPDGLVVAGYLYDVTSGRLQCIVEGTPVATLRVS